ncbi:MAG: GAF domain-containing protein [Chloroflexota bacterium]|nr:GAF domain-containing protein [Chloroflexota bacterium]
MKINLPTRPKPVAVVYADYREVHRFRPHDDQSIRQFVGRAGVILQRAWRYEKVLNLGEEINQQPDPETLFWLLDGRIRDILDSGDRFTLGVLDPLTEGLTRYVSNKGEVVKDEPTPLTPADRAAILARSVARILSDGQPEEIFVPLVFRDMPLGFFSIEQARADPFDNEDLRVIELLQNHVATALNGIRLFALLDTITHVAKQLREEVTTLDAFRAYAENVRRGSGADVVLLYRWHPEEGFIVPPFVAGELLHPEFQQSTRPDPMLARVAQVEEGIFCEDASTLLPQLGLAARRGTFQKREEIVSAAAIPLLVGETAGVLFINYRKRQQFAGPHKRLIRILAAFAATALQSSQRFEQREGQRTQEMELIRRVDAELNRSTRLNEVLDTILTLANGYIGADQASVLLADAQGETFKLLAAIGTSSKKLVGWEESIAGSGGIVRWVFEHAKPVLARDLKNEEPWKDLYVGGKNIRSELDVPLMADDRVIGVLNFESRRKDAFTERQRDFIRDISGQFVLAIKRAQDYESRAKELELFWDFARATVGHLEMAKLLDATLEKTVGTVGATTGVLLLYDNMNGRFSVRSAYGYDRPIPAHYYSVAEGVIGKAAKELFRGDPSPFVTPSERWLVGGSRSVIVAPIRREPKLLGEILLTCNSPVGFGESTERITEVIAGMIAITLENAEEYEKSEKDHEALHALSKQVLQVASDPTEALHSVVRLALTLTNSTRSDLDVYENNKLTRTYFCDMVDGAPSMVGERSLDPMPPDVVRGVMHHVATTRLPYYTKGDAQNDPLYKPGIPGIRSELAVPLLTRTGELLGVLNVESKAVNAFDKRTEHLLELFGDAAVIAFEIARSREIINVAMRLAEMPYENYSAACDLVADTAAAHCGSLAVVRLYDRRHDELVLISRAGPGKPPFERIKGTDGLTGRAMQSGELQCIDDLANPQADTPKIVLSDDATRSLLIVPVIVNGVRYGSVGLSHPQPSYFGELEKSFVLSLARLLGSTLQRFESQRRQIKQKRNDILSAAAQDALDLHHDFNSLRFVSSLITLAQNALDRNDYDRARSEYAKVNTVVENAVELTRAVRDRMGSIPEPVNLNVRDVIRKAVEDARVPPTVTVVENIPAHCPMIFADPYDVSKILNHLVANAVDAMQDRRTLTFTVRDAAMHVEIDVTDTGCGMDPQFVIDFETASHPKPGHTGWGLRSALRRAEFNDGRLFVARTSSEGTTFTLQLPKAAAPEDWETSVDHEPTPSNRVV